MMPASVPSISTNVPTGVSSTAMMTSSRVNSSRYFWYRNHDLQAEPRRAPLQHAAVGDDRLEFLADLHRAGLHRALEGEDAARRRRVRTRRVDRSRTSDPSSVSNRRSSCSRRPRSGRGAGGQHRGARVGGVVEPQLDFPLERPAHDARNLIDPSGEHQDLVRAAQAARHQQRLQREARLQLVRARRARRPGRRAPACRGRTASGP